MPRAHDQLGMMTPGAGLHGEFLELQPVKERLRDGTYDHAPFRAEANSALADLDTIPDEILIDLVERPEQKGFKNAYVSCLVEEGIFYDYTNLVVGPDNRGVYKARYNDGRSTLEPLPNDAFDTASAREIASTLATSNQDVLAHLICEEFREGNVPTITGTGDRAKDQEYLEDFSKLAEIVVHLGRLFKIVPEEAGAASTVVASGTFALKAAIFELPNLISAINERDGLQLTPAQHRASMLASAQVTMLQLYLPTLPVAVRSNRELVDPKTRELKPEVFTHNNDPDRLIVFPDPDLITAANATFEGKEIPVQTNCPVYHSKVKSIDRPEQAFRFPGMVLQTTLKQLDQHYYPKLRQEYMANVLRRS